MLLTPAQIEWFKQAWPGPLARQTSWLFSFGEIMHFVGLCLLLGAIFFIDLRLMGYFKSQTIRSVLSFLPFAIVGFLMNAASGWIFFTSNPASYLVNPSFILKMALIGLAGLNALAFTVLEHRHALAIGSHEDTTTLTKVLAGGSLILWLAILFLGRWLPLFTVGTN